MSLTDEQKAKIEQKEIEMPQSLKREDGVNYREGWFFVTLNTRDEVPVLSTCEGDPALADGEAGAPRCIYTKVGEGVMKAWKSIPTFHPRAAVDMVEIMPEHVHGLLYLKPGNREHLGHIIRGFMIACSHAYWDTLGIDWRADHPTCGQKTNKYKGVATPEYVDRDHTMSMRGPALFVHGYNDMEPITEAEVEIKRAYIRDQARKRLVQGDRHECFIKCRQQHSINWTEERIREAISRDPGMARDSVRCMQAQNDVLERLNRIDEKTGERLIEKTGESSMTNIGEKPLLGLDYIGPKGLLFTKQKFPLICHRTDAADFERQKEMTLQAARKGAVIVSAFISPKEREIREQLMQELLPVVEIMDNGIAERYKPSGKAFYAMAENRLLQITPWRYEYQKEGTIVSREMCLVMNELARLISGQPDDWWKNTSPGKR